jgi:hypothetical protein
MAATQARLVLPKYHKPKHAFEKAASDVIKIVARSLPADVVEAAPNLAPLARKLLSAFASQSSSEWMHKLTGNICTAVRCKLSDESVELALKVKTAARLLRSSDQMDAEVAACQELPTVLKALNARIADRKAAAAARLAEQESFENMVWGDGIPRLSVNEAEEEDRLVAEEDGDVLVDGFDDFLTALGLTADMST